MLGAFRELALEELKYAAGYPSHWYLNVVARRRATVLVNGAPKTGTTWMCKMIASVPGYKLVEPVRRGIAQLNAAGPGDVLHGHYRLTPRLDTLLRNKDIRTILMVRDLRDQAVSMMFQVRRDDRHPFHGRMNILDHDEALMACIEGRDDLPGSESMIKLTELWLTSELDRLCVKYENLLENPAGELTSVAEYLGLEISSAFLKVLVQRTRFERLISGRRFWRSRRQRGQEDTTSHFRKGTQGDWKNHFSERHKERFKAVAGDALIAMGYETGTDW